MSTKCVKCQKSAYPMESATFDSKLYHKSCLRCSACNAVQTSLKNICNMNNDIYCKSCFTKAFRTKGSYTTIEQVSSPKPDDATTPVPAQEAAPVVEEKKEEVAPVVVEEKKEEAAPVVVEEVAPVVEEAAPVVVEEVAPVVEEKKEEVVEEKKEEVVEEAVVAEEVAPVVVEEKKEEVVVEIKKEAAPVAQPESVKELVFSVVEEDEVKPLPTTETPAFLSPKTDEPRGRTGSVVGRTASMSIGGTAKCKKCEKSAYPMESLNFDGNTYHKSCLRCSACNAVQTSLKNVCNMNNDIYCKSCFTKAFRTKGSYSTIEQVASPTAQ